MFKVCGIEAGFLPAPLVVQDRNAHNLQKDFNSEEPLYTQTEALVASLVEWVAEQGGGHRR